MKYGKIILHIVIGIIIVSLLLYINKQNYQKHKEITFTYVNHPDSIMNKDLAKFSSFGFENLRADLYWLQTIQYIGGNAVSAEYKKFLYAITDLTTHLNPYFEHPYIISQLLLPSENKQYEDFNDEEYKKYREQAIKIGLKGIKNFCDSEKIEKITQENNLLTIWSNEEYKNPCKSFKIPYYLAFIYYYYQKDPATASDYYKIASANDDAVSGAKTMAAIMAGKGGNREKSIFMFLNIAQSLENDSNGVCGVFSKQLNDIATGIFHTQQLSLSDEIIRSIEIARLETFGPYKENEDNIGNETSCINYLYKASRELNLAFLDQANNTYKSENDGVSALTPQELYEKKYIQFIPTDYQQDETNGIVYKYDPELQIFDTQLEMKK